MRRYCLRLAIHCMLAAGTAAAAPATLRWQTDVARPQPRDWEVFRGETIVLAPVMTESSAGVDLSGAACAMWYQTNGMADAWWSVPAATGTVAGEVRATWAPTNDCGAARYNYFIDASSSAGTMYRAHGRLIMRHAPGATPSILAAPTTLTDAMQAWADARYDPLGSAQTASNALAAAVQAEALARESGDAAARTNWQAVVYSLTNGAALGTTALQPSWAPTGHVATAGYADAAERAATADWAAEATYATDAGSAMTLDPYSADGQALAAATAHADSPAAHPDIRAAIDAATNALAGNIMGGDLPVQRWKMFDFGVSSNRWLILTNDVLEIWEQ